MKWCKILEEKTGEYLSLLQNEGSGYTGPIKRERMRQMVYERKLAVIKNGNGEDFIYYVKQKEESDFDCVMYNVGIQWGNKKKEIDDFSPSYDEAKALCDYLYDKNVSADNLFLIAEEFITAL